MNITSYKRKNIHSGLKGETLSRGGLLSSQDGIRPIRIAPELNVVKIGGHGVMDYGAQAILPLVAEIKELCRNHQMLIMTGGGVRVRHIMDIGIDLGMPTGVLASLASKVSEQNAVMMSVLLSDAGGEYIANTDLLDVLNMQKIGILPVTAGTPPYGIFEIPPESGIIPQYRTDSGAVIAAEMLGAKSCILVKNCAGLFDKNPALCEDAELIEEITADELIGLHMDDMVLEYKAVEILSHCKNLSEIKIINGHTKGELTNVMNGGKPGTVIRK